MMASQSGSFKFAFIFIILLFLIQPLSADSPLTSTPLYKAYLDIPQVKSANQTKKISFELAEYLASPSSGLDNKIAVINALSWGKNARDNAQLFASYLSLKYQTPLKKIEPGSMDPEDLLVLAYMLALSDYFKPERSMKLIEMAQSRLSSSFTANLVLTLNRAQAMMDTDFCGVYSVGESLFQDKTLKRDIRPGAVTIVQEYLQLYKTDCNTLEPKPVQSTQL